MYPNRMFWEEKDSSFNGLRANQRNLLLHLYWVPEKKEKKNISGWATQGLYTLSDHEGQDHLANSRKQHKSGAGELPKNILRRYLSMK